MKECEGYTFRYVDVYAVPMAYVSPDALLKNYCFDWFFFFFFFTKEVLYP